MRAFTSGLAALALFSSCLAVPSVRFGERSLSADKMAALRAAVEGHAGSRARLLLSPEVGSQMGALRTEDGDEDADVAVANAVAIQARQADPTTVPDGLPDGHICMEKTMFVEETEFEKVMNCSHITQESCFESFTTKFKPGPKEECETKIHRPCRTEYVKEPYTEMVETCRQDLSRDCSAEGETTCTKEYEIVCSKRMMEVEVMESIPNCVQEIENVCKTDDLTGKEWCEDIGKDKCTIEDKMIKKTIPKTECANEEREVCGPEVCPLVKLPEVCRTEPKTRIRSVPQERCELIPQKICSTVTRMIPSLEKDRQCVQVPKEVCATSWVNPTRVQKPVKKLWCGPEEVVNAAIADATPQGPPAPTGTTK